MKRTKTKPGFQISVNISDLQVNKVVEKTLRHIEKNMSTFIQNEVAETVKELFESEFREEIQNKVKEQLEGADFMTFLKQEAADVARMKAVKFMR